MSYDRMADRKAELEKELDDLYEAAEQEAEDVHGDVFLSSNSEGKFKLVDEFVDQNKADEIRSEWEEINSCLMSIEHNQGWH